MEAATRVELVSDGFANRERRFAYCLWLRHFLCNIIFCNVLCRNVEMVCFCEIVEEFLIPVPKNVPKLRSKISGNSSQPRLELALDFSPHVRNAVGIG